MVLYINNIKHQKYISINESPKNYSNIMNLHKNIIVFMINQFTYVFNRQSYCHSFSIEILECLVFEIYIS